MRNVTLTLSAAILALAAGGVAMAQSARDADMTRADAETRAAEAFARMDANQDGKLDAADREARKGEAFARLDTDGNGSLSEEEFNARREGRQHAMRGHGERGGMRHAMRGGHDGRGGMMGRMADSNGDGAITQDEFTAGALARFDSADADKNGTVTAEERRAAHEQMRSQRQGQMRQKPPVE